MATSKKNTSKPLPDKGDKEKLNRLKVVLAEKDKSQKWLAEQMDKGENTVSNWVGNRNQPILSDLKKIAGLLGVTMCELLNEGK
jgi:putative transcriptional regulator